MRIILKVSILFFLLSLAACTSLPIHPPDDSLRAYALEPDPWHFNRHAPVFVVDKPELSYNRIGTPSARMDGDEETVFVDGSQPTIYVRKTKFTTERGVYTNLTYRIHFEKVPFGPFPPNLGWGDNVGLLLVVTLNDSGQPVLFTTVQTCGCYLTFVPTTYLPEDAFPPGWDKDRQKVYGESLPGLIDYAANSPTYFRLMVLLQDRSHRIMDMWLADSRLPLGYETVGMSVKPLKTLEGLSLPGGASTSFYQTEGSGHDYVKNSQKPWERLFMSWWAFDWRVGVDKKLGRDREDGIVFYTSLKPWARTASDMRNFPVFLQYWDWNL